MTSPFPSTDDQYQVNWHAAEDVRVFDDLYLDDGRGHAHRVGWGRAMKCLLLIGKQGELETPSATDKQPEIILAKQPYPTVFKELAD